MNPKPPKLNACILAAAIAAALPGIASAQSADTATPTELDAVSVTATTGSRVARDGFSAPTPTNVLSPEELQAEAPANIATFVNTLPSVTGSQNSSTNSGSLSNGQAGISALGMRGLGAGRTLVLLDGQRSVTSSSTGLVDTNTFPQSLIRQVEVVTGGASAAYGSDAIGGVVNFILDRYYTGIKGAAEYGQTERGDNHNNKFNLTGGWSFADGRGHVLLSAETVRSDGIDTLDRDWADRRYFGAINSVANREAGGPYYVTGYDFNLVNHAPGGLIVGGPLGGTYFGDGGSIHQLQYGEVLNGTYMMRGGDTATMDPRGLYKSNSLWADDDRKSVFARSSYWVTDNFEVFAQASYAEYEGYSYYIRPTSTGGNENAGGILIRQDNAYLPQDIIDRMAAAGLSSFNLNSSNADLPQSGSNIVRDTTRVVLGAEGEFDWWGKGWNWDAYYQYGKTETDEQLTDTINYANWALATDAVFDGAGNIVCRSTLIDPGNGCVPYNHFGIGVADPAAVAYVLGAPQRSQKFEQSVFAASMRTNDIPGWAGPISLAFGAEHRTEKMSGHVDPYSSLLDGSAQWKYGNFVASEGKYDVTEAFVETVIPLFRGFDFNGAVRYTDYELSGGVTTWKAGIVYAPVDDITLRATLSHDIRAPNMEEWYAAGTGRTNNYNITANPGYVYQPGDLGWQTGTQTYLQSQIGNQDLKPEEADALGIGLVWTPGFLPGFAASVDYYDIEIEDVIATLNVDTTILNCLRDGVQFYCDNVIVNADGSLNTVVIFPQNLNSMKSRGVDVELSYRFELGPGDLALRALGTRYLENVTDSGVGEPINLAGSSGATPGWLYRLSAMYNTANWRFFVTGTGRSSTKLSNAYIECQTGCPAQSTLPSGRYTIDDNSVAGGIYFDAGLSRSFDFAGARFDAFFNVSNLFDKDPIYAASPASSAENTPAYPQVANRADALGRAYRVGVRFEF